MPEYSQASATRTSKFSSTNFNLKFMSNKVKRNKNNVLLSSSVSERSQTRVQAGSQAGRQGGMRSSSQASLHTCCQRGLPERAKTTVHQRPKTGQS
jgi:hypothetical protein